MKLSEKTLHQEWLYRGKILNLRRDVVELSNGHQALREVVEHSGGVCVLPVDQEGWVLLVRQYRHPYQEVVLEAPAGKRNPGEEPLACGIRELEEETGCVAQEYIDLGTLYPSPGYCGEVIHIYAALGLTRTQQHLDEDEFLDVVPMPLQEALDLVRNNQLPDAKTQVALLKYSLLAR